MSSPAIFVNVVSIVVVLDVTAVLSINFSVELAPDGVDHAGTDPPISNKSPELPADNSVTISLAFP